jgi:hypothetical protein
MAFISTAHLCSVLAASLTLGCAGVKAPVSGGGGNSGTGNNSGAGGNRNGGNSGTGAAGATGGGRDGGACQQIQYKFEPKIPTVYLLVDRSGSMFDCVSTPGNVEASCATPSDTSWSKLKDAVETVTAALDAQVRFGFAAFMGTNPASGGTCPIISKVTPKLNNNGDIKTLYDSLPFPPNSTQQGVKFETPASETLVSIGAELTNDPTPGDKYVLFVTDGQPDYCDDSNSLCAPDSVIAAIQGIKKKGITTIVIGLQTVNFDLPAGILQALANAGAGEPTVAPLRAGAADTFAFFDQCNSVAGWHNDLTASGQLPVRGVTLGTYSATAGPTKPYTPAANDQTMLVNQLSAALSGVKSCTFDLGNIDGKAIKVDRTQLALAHVLIEGAEVPLNQGWRMNTDTQLELIGDACTKWRSPDSKNIEFRFPCEIIVVP